MGKQINQFLREKLPSFNEREKWKEKDGDMSVTVKYEDKKMMTPTYEF